MKISPTGDADADLLSDIQENEQLFKRVFLNCSDVSFREITTDGQVRLLLIYVANMVNSEELNTNILKPLFYEGLPQGLDSVNSISQMLEQSRFSVLHIMTSSNVSGIVECVLRGHVAILVDGESSAIVADVTNFESRTIGEPSEEATLRGSRESFTELLTTNTTMMRRIFATPDLKMEQLTLGKYTKTEIVIAYLEGVVDLSVLDEVRKRVKRIRIDGILESGYIEESIEDTHFSPFPQILNSERPDVVAAGLLEGKVAILTNGTPIALIVPMTFWAGLQAPDDYFERFLFVTLNRWIRYMFVLISVFLPSIYIALTDFNPEMVPAKLMLSIAALREKAPFPTVIEVFMMEFVFEALREAGIRLPRQIGPLVSIVGALVIGEAAVRAGIISAPIVIIVPAAGISSFVIPRYSFSFPMRILRFPMLILAGLFGLFGIAIGIIAILIHLIHLQPFGTPYLSPVAPLKKGKLKDVLMRWPHKLTRKSEPVPEADNP
ncbi:spore germination protein [Paenibacillus sp. BC26]|uniref:spore germination protein n=1 Tax=Paenibacillus sp. BC26 TaxID=1881032 RepID=UPI0008F0C998|nr:spore germination protein [Paenibacillus sp. BC26]SFT07961.1 spore germination protein KA [Paenibacillus sp. BC26]